MRSVKAGSPFACAAGVECDTPSTAATATKTAAVSVTRAIRITGDGFTRVMGRGSGPFGEQHRDVLAAGAETVRAVDEQNVAGVGVGVTVDVIDAAAADTHHVAAIIVFEIQNVLAEAADEHIGRPRAVEFL